MDFLFGSKIQVGVDIGTSRLKWAAVDRRKGLCYVWDADLFPERSSAKDTLPEERLRELLKERLGQCKKAQSHAWNRSVTCNASGTGIHYGYLETEKKKPKDLKFAVASSLLKDLPYPLEDFQLSVVPVHPLSLKEERSAAFYAVVPNETVALQLQRLGHCGLKLAGVDTAPVALARELGHNHPEDTDLWALVHSGSERTVVVVARGANLYYVREFPVAGAQFTYAFQMGKQVSWEEAERDKLLYDVALGEHFVEPFMMRWLDEVRKSLDHFKSKYRLEVARVALSGGTACWQGLAARLEAHLKLPVVLDGWSQIRPDSPRSDQDALVHKVSIGMALG